MSKTAHILAVRATHLPARIKSTGFHPVTHEQALDILNEAGTFLGPRQMLEEDERFRQIIPYIVVRQGPDVIGYVRGASGSEARLHGKIALGAGGHIDLPDIYWESDGSIALGDTLARATKRELEEELQFIRRDGPLGHRRVAVPPVRWVGLVIDNADAVGRVHIGLVGIVECETEIEAREDCISQLDSFSVAELHAARDRLEGWAGVLLDGYLT